MKESPTSWRLLLLLFLAQPLALRAHEAASANAESVVWTLEGQERVAGSQCDARKWPQPSLQSIVDSLTFGGKRMVRGNLWHGMPTWLLAVKAPLRGQETP